MLQRAWKAKRPEFILAVIEAAEKVSHHMRLFCRAVISGFVRSSDRAACSSMWYWLGCYQQNDVLRKHLIQKYMNGPSLLFPM